MCQLVEFEKSGYIREHPELIFSSIDTFLKSNCPTFFEKVNALEPLGKM
jgi:hypothetical protein